MKIDSYVIELKRENCWPYRTVVLPNTALQGTPRDEAAQRP